MECEPAAAKLAVHVALELVAPGMSVTGEHGNDTPLSRKVTVPVGGSPVTVAVNVVLCPINTLLGDAVNVTVVDFLATAMALLVPVIEAVTVSVAVIVLLPDVFSVALNVPMPLVSVALAGSTAAPSVLVKCAVPA
jgi:hypothetical protein